VAERGSVATQDNLCDATSSDRRTTDFLRLYSASQARVFSYIFSLLPNWHDCEEVFQDMSVVLWRAFDDFQPGTDFRSWAFKIAFHQVLSYRKRIKRSSLVLGDRAMEAIANEIERNTGGLDDQLEALAQCVERLPERSREILDRCYQPGTNTKTAAAAMGRPAGTIYKALTRIRQLLFDCIRQSLSTEAGG
jgi:RNA polymerase sigma-70 factor, ECF subfamily